MDFREYILPELLIIIPVLYIIGAVIKASKIKDKYIPLILGGISILLCSVFVFATGSFSGYKEVLPAIFTALTQGVLLAGSTVYINQLIKQGGKEE